MPVGTVKPVGMNQVRQTIFEDLYPLKQRIKELEENLATLMDYLGLEIKYTLVEKKKPSSNP